MRPSLRSALARLAAVAVAPALASGCESAPPPAAPSPVTPPPVQRPPLPAEQAPLGRLPTDVHPTRETLTFTVDPAADGFSGTAEIALRLDKPRDVLWLHGRGLQVSAASLVLASKEEVPATWTEVDPSGVVRLALAHPVDPGEATLRVRWTATYDPSLVGVYRVKSGAEARPAVFTKFEAIYARRAFPGFDEPAFKIPFDVALTVPATSSAIGNMPIVEEVPIGDGQKRVHFAATPPLPTYLVAFAVGAFESHGVTVPPSALRPSPLPMPLGVVSLVGRGKESAFALAESPALLAEEERYFGVPFPYPKLDLIAVPDFQSGAMENAGAITFRDSALLVDEATASLGQKVGVRNTIAHEMAHQWFGDLTTMEWWNDLWLNEGFATFLASRTLQAVHPELEARLDQVLAADAVMRSDGLPSARRVRQPIESTHDITNAFDSITYDKGSAVLVMVEHYLGAETFRRGVHRYLEEHAAKNGTTDELVAALSKEAGKDVAPLFASFLDQPGVPVIHARSTCHAGHGQVLLETSRWRPSSAPSAASAAGVPIAESTATDPSWDVPVCVRARTASGTSGTSGTSGANGGGGGSSGEVTSTCTLLSGPKGTIDLPACADWIYPNSDAAGYYRFVLAPDDLAHLRERGMNTLSTAERMALAESLQASFDAGSLPAAEVLRAFEPLAHDPHGAVATLPTGVFSALDDTILPPDLRPKWRAHLSQLYAPVVSALGWKAAPGDDRWKRIERANLLGFLALGIEDAKALADGARLGRAYLGLGGDGKLHPEAVDADLAGVALEAAARQARGDRRVFDALVAALGRSEDASARRRFLRALGDVRDTQLVRRALALSLETAPAAAVKLRQTERLTILAAFLSSRETRTIAWTWLQAHFDALVPLLPDRAAGQVPGMVGFCDEGEGRDLQAFFAPRMEKLTGGPRNLTQAVDRIAQCAARVDAQRESARRYVEALRR